MPTTVVRQYEKLSLKTQNLWASSYHHDQKIITTIDIQKKKNSCDYLYRNGIYRIYRILFPRRFHIESMLVWRYIVHLGRTIQTESVVARLHRSTCGLRHWDLCHFRATFAPRLMTRSQWPCAKRFWTVTMLDRPTK